MCWLCMALWGAAGGGCVKGPRAAQAPHPELFILEMPEVAKGRAAPEQPLGLGPGICMEGGKAGPPRPPT